MKYEFYVHINKQYGWRYLRVKVEDEKYSVIQNILTSDNWTPTIAQSIIDGVEGSRTKSFAEAYTWGNEDVIVKSMEHGVFLWDMMARRADKNHPKEQDLQLTHDEFITFMQDFKKFIEENQ